ncbi:hypothetical protein [Bradyrhizobium sp. CCBAU 45389]|uniref:hypothetical protein n=1 Tax=Bradyrhizobium sp. CCBAU 45389 TaxID=858429 RepID=UPI0023066079|nr:hypothetical protein [Bradyrhizobium sp. CCBAU 45389]
MTKEELKVIADLVVAYCGRDTKNTGEVLVDSGAIGVNAAAMYLLVRYGLMEADTQAGRRIRARWTAAGRDLLGRQD